MAGVAIDFVSIDATAEFSTPIHLSDRSTRGAFQAGTGIASVVAQRWTLGAEVRYLVGTFRSFGATFRLDSLLVSGAVSCWF